MDSNATILWVDDEIDLLKPHIIFLESKGYRLSTCNNGAEAIEMVQNEAFDIVFLDEQMPGLSGIETLTQIKKRYSNLPVVMITKSEEERIMEDAIGSNIADYLIKPVNPKQILLCLKKNLENKKLVSEKSTFDYQQEFRQISMELNGALDFERWSSIYQRLSHWDVRLGKSEDSGMLDILAVQKDEANQSFCKYITKNYVNWLQQDTEDKPVMSHTLLKDKVFPLLGQEMTTFMVVIDNLRFDQWQALKPLLEELFRIKEEGLYMSILPTTTMYARNALFAGLMPSEIKKKYPGFWLDEDAEGSKNQFEEDLLSENLKRYGKNVKYAYQKIVNLSGAKKLQDNIHDLMNNDFNVIVYNFVDMLSHARTEMEIIRELASDEPAYRSLTLSWFEHSPLYEIIRFVAEKGARLIITTDHGSIRVKEPVKVIGDKNTNTNLRYKVGKSLNYPSKKVFSVKRPEEIYLPRMNVSSSYIFSYNTDFLAYPNNYNYYVNYYRNTFQHGGISLEEMLIPFIVMNPK
ncbi:MAG: two-component system response regulator [Bacteroidetes bacterium]|nr:MAG: two-component system response regulator [Bacteroidota bacterium]PIE87718.1 MAG: two-component system response regulator [Bacteroidota bacterium]